MNDDFGIYMLSILVGFAVGVFASWQFTSSIKTPNYYLKGVGIERIEKCHNVQSNWFEIVWSKDVDKDGKYNGGK